MGIPITLDLDSCPMYSPTNHVFPGILSVTTFMMFIDMLLVRARLKVLFWNILMASYLETYRRVAQIYQTHTMQSSMAPIKRARFGGLVQIAQQRGVFAGGRAPPGAANKLGGQGQAGWPGLLSLSPVLPTRGRA